MTGKKLISLIFITALLCLPGYAMAAKGPVKSGFDKEAPLNLIKRMLPKYAAFFEVQEIAADNGKDVFEIESNKGKIILRGNNPISVASAFNYYLKHIAHCQITWNGSNTNLPTPIPAVREKIRKRTAYQYRYYLNYCTFNYTMSWWDWKRWQWEIDWMAMNGINTPLAVTGQNIIHSRVYKSMGFTDKDLESFFSGPAYFSWFWMGNLDGWGGPLPKSWMQSHEVLQKKIVARERELGMKPVLPAFTGHVPPSFKQKFPQARLKVTSWNQKFPDVYLLDPEDPLFVQIGKKFIEEQTKAYGTDHLYSADTFNENKPPSNDSLFLNNIGKKVYQSMAAADTAAIWVMQGWLFHFSAKFWQQPQIMAMLNGVPNEKMIILDLWSERHPLWQQTHAYYGKPWIWNMLSNFGGNISLQGVMDKVATEPSAAYQNKDAGNMVGIGLTPEGIEQNPVMYELMMENVWQTTPLNLDTWLNGYAQRRYGKANTAAEQAWQILRKSVYADTLTNGGPESIICARPTFSRNTSGVTTRFPYDNKDLLKAWELLISASDELKNAEGYQYDIVDVTRQVLANYATYQQQMFADAYRQKDTAAFRKSSAQFIQLITDMDELLATRKDFLLGPWLNSAKAWATTEGERRLYEKNARNLITLWGDKNSTLREYACKQWSGLLSGFYKPRWEQYFAYANQRLHEGKAIDQNTFNDQIKEWEWRWVHQTESYTDKPAGNAVTKSEQLYNKYFKNISYAVNNIALAK